MNRSWNVRAHGRTLAMGLALSGLTAVIAQGGCASSDTPEFVLLPDAGNGSSATGGSSSSGSGGSVGSGGSNDTGGSFGTGGNSTTGSGGNRATGGTIGSGGSGPGTGGNRATGGNTGSGGMVATGGSTGSGGMTTTGSGGARATGGSGGMRATGGSTGSGGMTTTGAGGSRATGGTSGSGGSTGTAPTFTQIYTQILSVSCSGSQCHNPGSQGGVSFSSQSNAYNSVKSRVTAGNATGSSFYSTVNTGKMPPGGKLPASQLQMIADWINAGAMNN